MTARHEMDRGFITDMNLALATNSIKLLNMILFADGIGLRQVCVSFFEISLMNVGFGFV